MSETSWTPPKPARGKTYSLAEWQHFYRAWDLPAVAAVGQAAEAFEASVRGHLADAGHPAETFARLLDHNLSHQLRHDLAEGLYHDIRLDRGWNTNFADKANRTPENLAAAVAKVEKIAASTLAFLRLADVPWLYRQDADPQSVVDYGRQHEQEAWRLRELAVRILTCLHGIRFGHHSNGDRIPTEYDVMCGEASVADLLRIQREKAEAWQARQREWARERRAAGRRVYEAMAERMRGGASTQLAAVNRVLARRVPGASIHRAISSGKDVAVLEVKGVGRWYGPPVGRDDAVKGLLFYLQYLVIHEPETEEAYQSDYAAREYAAGVVRGKREPAFEPAGNTIKENDSMTGKELVALMRKNKVTIKALSQRMDITMKRIREVRERGLTDPNTIRDWIEGITGKDPQAKATEAPAEEPRGNFLTLGICPRVGQSLWALVSVPGDVNYHPVPAVVERVDNIDDKGLSNTYLTATTAYGNRRVNIDSSFTHKPELRDGEDGHGSTKKWIVPSAEEERQAKRFSDKGERILEQVRALSSGTLAGLSGESKYEALDALHAEFVRWTQARIACFDPDLAWESWQDAWAGFVREFPQYRKVETVRIYTTAPVDYDGFGTKTVIANVGTDGGKQVRLVETPRESEEWQRSRYFSGCHAAYDLNVWKDLAARGLVTDRERDAEDDAARAHPLAGRKVYSYFGDTAGTITKVRRMWASDPVSAWVKWANADDAVRYDLERLQQRADGDFELAFLAEPESVERDGQRFSAAEVNAMIQARLEGAAPTIPVDVPLPEEAKPEETASAEPSPREVGHCGLQAAVVAFRAAQERHPDMLLLFRADGDYLALHEDAEVLVRLLGLTLAQRDGVRWTGFPAAALEGNLRKLLQAGQRVAVCDRVEEEAVRMPKSEPMPSGSPMTASLEVIERGGFRAERWPNRLGWDVGPHRVMTDPVVYPGASCVTLDEEADHSQRVVIEGDVDPLEAVGLALATVEAEAAGEESKTPPADAVPAPDLDAPEVRPFLLLPGNLGTLAKLVADGPAKFGATAGVQLTSTRRGYRAVATNGRVLGLVEGEVPAEPEKYPAIPAVEAAPGAEASCVVPADAWTKAFRALPKRTRSKPILANLAVAVGKDQSTLASTDLDSVNVLQPRHVEGRFPDVDRVLPTGEPMVRFLVDPKLFVDVLSVAGAFREDGLGGVVVEVYDPAKPITVRARGNGQTFTGLVVPLVLKAA